MNKLRDRDLKEIKTKILYWFETNSRLWITFEISVFKAVLSYLLGIRTRRIFGCDTLLEKGTR